MKSVAIVGLGWLGLPLAQHLKKLGWRVKGSKQSFADAQRLHQLGIEAYPFSFSEKMNSLPDNIQSLFDVDALIVTLPPSRFWSVDTYKEGTNPPSFDKQFVRDWLEQSGWNKQPPAPKVPKEVIEKTVAKYQEALDLLTK